MNVNSSMKKIIPILVIALALFVIFKRDRSVATYPTPAQNNATTTEPSGRSMTLEDYLKLNISELSSQAGTPEVFGGKFFVTDIKAAEGAGLVSYEDGHNAYSANFTYSIDGKGFITVTSFDVKE
jgi:hypothetical protein